MTDYSTYVSGVKTSLDALPLQQVEAVVDVLFQAWLAGRQVFVMGNGGSASTASHMACDLGKNTAVGEMPRLRVMSLNDNMALFSALSNDDGYENVFAQQLASFVNAGDVVIAISASGNSPNVLNAVRLAQARGALTIGWSGYAGGQLAQMVDLPLVVTNNIIEQVEDIHLMLEHMVTTGLRQAMLDYQATALYTLPVIKRTGLASHALTPAAD